MRCTIPLGALASIASWTSVLAFLMGAFYDSTTVMLAALALGLMSLGIDVVILRRKLASRT